MIWPLTRKPKPPVHVGPTSVDWQPGDMAECVEEVWWKYCGKPWYGPRKGTRALVTGVHYGTSVDGQTKTFALRLLGWELPRQGGYAAVWFRKILLTDTGADRKREAPADHEQAEITS